MSTLKLEWQEKFSRRMFPKEKEPTLVETMTKSVPYKRIKKAKPAYDLPPPPRISKALEKRNNSSQMGTVMEHELNSSAVKEQVKDSRGKSSHVRRNSSGTVWTVMKDYDPSEKRVEEKNLKQRRKMALHERSSDFPLVLSLESSTPSKMISDQVEPTTVHSLVSAPAERKSVSQRNCTISGDALPTRRVKGKTNKKAEESDSGDTCEQVLKTGLLPSRMVKKKIHKSDESPSCGTFVLVKKTVVYDPILNSYTSTPVFRVKGEKLWQTKRPGELFVAKK